MRMFTHHALQTTSAKPLNDWLVKAGPVSALMQTARQLASLEAEVLSLVRVWRECPRDKRPSIEALLDRIKTVLSHPDEQKEGQ